MAFCVPRNPGDSNPVILSRARVAGVFVPAHKTVAELIHHALMALDHQIERAMAAREARVDEGGLTQLVERPITQSRGHRTLRPVRRRVGRPFWPRSGHCPHK